MHLVLGLKHALHGLYPPRKLLPTTRRLPLGEPGGHVFGLPRRLILVRQDTMHPHHDSSQSSRWTRERHRFCFSMSHRAVGDARVAHRKWEPQMAREEQ